MTGYETLQVGTVAIDLSDRGKLRLAGEDRARLLHAMSTNDVNHLLPGHGLQALFLSAQGRILADALIYNLGESLWLDTEPEVGAKLRDHLDKYIIADDVEMRDESSSFGIFSLEGAAFHDTAIGFGWPVPSQPLQVVEWGGGFVSRTGSVTGDGVRFFFPIVEQRDLLGRLAAAEIPILQLEEREILRLEQGIPRYGQDVSERYLVQETGLLKAVHFNKGCYLGQEIVERVRSRGQVHRHLSRIQMDASTPPPVGTKLVWQGKEAGEITSAAYSPRLTKVVALAYLRTEAVDAQAEMVLAGDEAVRVIQVR